MRGSGNSGLKYRRCNANCKLQEALEDMFAEACLPGHSKEEAVKVCFERAKELHKLVNELVDTYAVAEEWAYAGSQRAYTAMVYVGPDGIRKGKDTEWHRTEVEAAPRPHPIYLFLRAHIIDSVLRLGYHMSISGSLDLAFDRAHEIGCNCMQIFLSNPRAWSMKELGEDDIERFRAKGKSFGVSPVFAHMPYLPNLASPREYVYKKSAEALREAMERCEALEVRYLIAHLGSTLGTDESAAFDRVVEAVQSAQSVSANTRILLENEAGQRNSVGSKLEELVQLYDAIGSSNVGFCVDTCHLFAAGYDIRKREVVNEIIGALGTSRIHAIHLNDAKYPLGSGLDRHESIGFGSIGGKGLRTFLGSAAVEDKPLIMETPREKSSTESELRLVRKLIRDIKT